MKKQIVKKMCVLITGDFEYLFPKGHTTSNRCRFDVDIKSIRQRENINKFPRHFDVLF